MKGEKQVFRRFAKGRLVKESLLSAYNKNKKFEKNLLYFLSRLHFRNILLFLPLPIEPDVRGAIKKLRKLKKRVYVPFIEDISFKIVKYRLPARSGAYGIQTCDHSLEFIRKIDIAIVPVVGVDSKFRRIGFGKGMYDRFFGQILHRPIIVFVQRTLCFVPKEIGEGHDTVGDYLALPNKIFVKGKINNAYNSVNGYGRRGFVGANRVFCGQKTRFGKISDIRGAVKIKSESDRARSGAKT